MAEQQDGMKTLLTVGLLGVGAYFIYEWLFAPQMVAGTTTTPGTTPTQTAIQPATSVTTTATSTPAPPSQSMATVAANMQSYLGQQTASADQWDYAFMNLIGKPIDQYAGFNFDSVYGPVVNGVRNNGATMSAMTFLQMGASAVSGGLPGLSGLGMIMSFPGPYPRQTGNMVYLWQHPLPYAPNYSLFHGFRGIGFHGMGDFTQASGFERAIYGGGSMSRLFQTNWK